MSELSLHKLGKYEIRKELGKGAMGVVYTAWDPVLEREVALKLIWGEDNYFNARSMDVYISKLRKYLREDEKLEIRNVHGRGFRLVIRE